MQIGHAAQSISAERQKQTRKPRPAGGGTRNSVEQREFTAKIAHFENLHGQGSSVCEKNRAFDRAAGNDIETPGGGSFQRQDGIGLDLFDAEHIAHPFEIVLRHAGEQWNLAQPIDTDESEEHQSELQSLMRTSYAVF